MKDSFILFVFVVMIALVCFCETMAVRARADNSQLRETLRQNVVTIGNMSAEIAVYKVEATQWARELAVRDVTITELESALLELESVLFESGVPGPRYHRPGFSTDPKRGWVQPPEAP